MLEAAYKIVICFDNDDYGVDGCHNLWQWHSTISGVELTPVILKKCMLHRHEIKCVCAATDDDLY